MMAGLLQKCGLYLGRNLIGILHDNPKGHFEDREFTKINAQIFEANSGLWGTPPKQVTLLPDKIEREMKTFLKKWPRDRLAGWKDPRACLTMQIWAKILYPEKLKVILILRSAFEIALSLQKRNKFPIKKSLKLTEFYLKKAYENLNEGNIPFIETRYHNYFKDWKTELTKICNFLGLTIPLDTKAIIEFIDPRLWHHRGED